MNPLFNLIKKVSATGASSFVKEVRQTIDEFSFSKEEKSLALEKITEAENKFNEFLISNESEITKAILADTANARSMQVAALQQEDKFSKRYLYYLASFIIISATAFGAMLFFVSIPEKNKRLVEMFCDVYLFAGALSVISFFFSSTIGSRKNSEVLRHEVLTKNGGANGN